MCLGLFALENTALPLSDVASLFQKKRLKSYSYLLLAEQKIISVSLAGDIQVRKKEKLLRTTNTEECCLPRWESLSLTFLIMH